MPPTRWLIQACLDGRPVGQVLHVFEDGSAEWSPDKTKALRFKSRHDAEAFAHRRKVPDFVASEHKAGDLLRLVSMPPMVGEVETLTSF